MNSYWIGIDGTDSPWGGCTTWTLSNIVDKLQQKDSYLSFLDYPYLIRLNPNIPEKTRGNGALALHISTKLSQDEIFDISKGQIRNDQSNYKLNPKKLPGLVVLQHKPNPEYYYQALIDYCSLELLNEFSHHEFLWPKLNQSHIGAVAAVAADLSSDFTYELLSYRSLVNCGTPREIDQDRVKEGAKLFSSTFSSYDFDQDRELIVPSGPDPVFCGIRGEDPRELVDFLNHLAIEENLASYTIFKTNQGTDAHSLYYNVGNSRSLQPSFCEPYQVFTGKVTIMSQPFEITGGHTFADARFKGEKIQLSWFEPTKHLRDKARQLQAGDIIYITGALMEFQNSINIHVEFMRIIDVKPNITYFPPNCSCGNRMTSAGAFAGYKCKDCGNSSKFPEIKLKDRDLFINQQVYAASSAQRHLTRPASRLHLRNRSLIEDRRNSIEYSEFRNIYD